MGVLYATWHKMNPKLEVKIKTSGLIQKCLSNHTTKRMVTKIYNAKLIYNGLTQKCSNNHATKRMVTKYISC
jgi:hypothetical protein